MNILIDDIPVNLQQMVDIIGIDKLIELSKLYGGVSISFDNFISLYIPIISTIYCNFTGILSI